MSHLNAHNRNLEGFFQNPKRYKPPIAHTAGKVPAGTFDKQIFHNGPYAQVRKCELQLKFLISWYSLELRSLALLLTVWISLNVMMLTVPAKSLEILLK